MREVYSIECGMHDAWYMVEHIINEGVLAEDGGVDEDEHKDVEDYYYTIEEGYCPSQDRTYLTLELLIHTDDGKTTTKIMPCGWYQGEPNDGDTQKYVGDLVGTIE